jgi:protein-disulfide isomerase
MEEIDQNTTNSASQEDQVPAEEMVEEEVSETQEPENRTKSDNTITFKRSHLYSVLLPLAFVLGLSVGYLFWGRTPPAAPPSPAQAAAPQPAAQAAAADTQDQQPQFKRYDVPVDDDPALGPDNAPITIIEFSDYQCPFCRQWHEDSFSKIKETFGDQVRFVYRDFPLDSLHPQAEPAAEAANCAREQDKFWEYHDKLFSGEYELGETAYSQIAKDLKLDVAAFEKCLKEGKYKAEVQADYQYAANLGIRSTPTFFINGIPLVGAQPFEVFQEVITKELAGELPK